jgi:hypothetical protein
MYDTTTNTFIVRSWRARTHCIEQVIEAAVLFLIIRRFFDDTTASDAVKFLCFSVSIMKIGGDAITDDIIDDA